ncbi:MAG: hypothetical protein QNJ98_17065 [Planctomycetota bacterium]|nr:hypothetical protein [Planctomycetota bacterium]
MRTALLVLFFLAIPSSLVAEEEPAAEAVFPASWQGSWKGKAELIRGGKTAMQFAMELHVEPLEGSDGWTWRIVYGEGDKRQVRPYELLSVDAAAGHYRIDEKNSIEIESFLENDNLRSRFWVADNVIEATYARDGDTLTVTLTTFGAKPARMSGGEGRVPPVASYALRSVQRAVLRR